jgi:hypothetical protein
VNFKALESVESAWMLKSPVIKNSWGVLDKDDISIWKSSRNWEKEAVSQDFAGKDGEW